MSVSNTRTPHSLCSEEKKNQGKLHFISVPEFAKVTCLNLVKNHITDARIAKFPFFIISSTYRHDAQWSHVQQSEVHHVEEFRVVFPSMRYTYGLHMPVTKVVGDGLHPNELGCAVRRACDPHPENHQLENNSHIQNTARGFIQSVIFEWLSLENKSYLYGEFELLFIYVIDWLVNLKTSGVELVKHVSIPLDIIQNIWLHLKWNFE